MIWFHKGESSRLPAQRKKMIFERASVRVQWEYREWKYQKMSEVGGLAYRFSGVQSNGQEQSSLDNYNREKRVWTVSVNQWAGNQWREARWEEMWSVLETLRTRRSAETAVSCCIYSARGCCLRDGITGSGSFTCPLETRSLSHTKCKTQRIDVAFWGVGGVWFNNNVLAKL